MSSGAQFLSQFDAIIGKNKEKLDLFSKNVVRKFTEALVANTPVKTGLLRGSWNMSIGAVSAYKGHPEPGSATLGIASPETMARLEPTIMSISYGAQVYIVNHADYATLVHDGGPGRIPKPFVTVTVSLAPQIIEEVLQEMAT